MCERYDVRLTAGTGVFVVAAVPESKADAPAIAVLRTGPGRPPLATQRPAELLGSLLRYADLHPQTGTELPSRQIDRRVDVILGTSASCYRWMLNGRVGENDVPPLTVRPGERVRIRYRNKTGMFHPMHVHGHTFALLDPTGPGTLKDTVIVLPGGTVTTALTADNPGQWILHCNNA
jgi:FtsP/CotA-like multicopper oxidase with cupredoxin domain